MDNIPAEIIKCCADIIAIPLVLIFNNCMSTGCFPDLLKIGKIIPIYKSGERGVYSNYRPISLLTNFLKIFEKLFNLRLKNVLAKYNIPGVNQFGFQNKKSTAMAVLEMVDKITNALDNKCSGIGIFVDLAKAFDTVNHSILLSKLEHYGIRGTQNKLLRSYLTDRKQMVFFDNVYSKTCKTTHGVPQGSILGPLLFLIYIDDLKNCSTLLKFILFADDTNIFNMHNNLTTLINTTNQELQNLSSWFKANKLSLNVTKTNFMIFSNVCDNFVKDNIIIELDGKQLERVTTSKFLGVFIDDELSWKPHISHVTNIIARVVGVFHRIRYKISTKTALMLYDTMIMPHLSYCTITWASGARGHLTTLFRLQKRAIRIVQQSRRLEHTAPLFIKLNRLNIYDLHTYQLCCLMHNCFHNDVYSGVFKNYFSFNSSIHTHMTRTAGNLHRQFARTTLRSNSLRLAGPVAWNAIPPHIRSASSFLHFKTCLKHWLLSLHDTTP